MHRELIGSDLTIVLSIILHLFEAGVFVVTDQANGSMGMGSLLAVFRSPSLAAATLLTAAISAGFGQWYPALSPSARLTLLVPQQTLLLITALGAVYGILHQTGADGIGRPWVFIACNQMHRMGMPILYSAAILARIRSRR